MFPATFIDQLNQQVFLPAPPRRIVSIVPSQTELLYDLGLNVQVAGITKFCIHPENWFNSKTKVGGTKNLNTHKIKILKPDLIIGNKEENDEQQILQLKNDYPVWMSDIKTLDDALNMIVSVGQLVNMPAKANEIKHQIITNFSKLKSELSQNINKLRGIQSSNSKPVIAYLIWKNPYMVAGGETFINSMIKGCGFKNAFENMKRYPAIDPGVLSEINADFILLSSEPFPFKQKHIDELQRIVPATKILLVDGEYFSWYGSRLINAPSYFLKFFKDLTHH